jgi:hypothetical protein
MRVGLRSATYVGELDLFPKLQLRSANLIIRRTIRRYAQVTLWGNWKYTVVSSVEVWRPMQRLEVDRELTNFPNR